MNRKDVLKEIDRTTRFEETLLDGFRSLFISIDIILPVLLTIILLFQILISHHDRKRFEAETLRQLNSLNQKVKVLTIQNLKKKGSLP